MADRIKGEHEKFCHECGEIIRAKAEICPNCGVRQPARHDLNSIAGNALGVGQPRSRVIAGVLGVLTGGVGLHKFYLGQPAWGVVYVLLCWTFLPAVIGLIEGLIYLTMSEDAFQARYGGPAWSAKR